MQLMYPLSRLQMHINPFHGRHQYSFQEADDADEFEDLGQGGSLALTQSQVASYERRHLDGLTIMSWIEDVARADGGAPSALAAYAGVASATFFLKAGDFFATTILVWVDEQDSSYLKRHVPLGTMYFLVRQMQADGSVISQDFGVSTLTELSGPQVEELHILALTFAQAYRTMSD